MARYFFHVRYGEESYLDEIGEDLPDNLAAWNEATASAGHSIRDLDGRLKPGTDWRMEVVDERGFVIYTIEVKAQTRLGPPASKPAARSPKISHP